MLLASYKPKYLCKTMQERNPTKSFRSQDVTVWKSNFKYFCKMLKRIKLNHADPKDATNWKLNLNARLIKIMLKRNFTKPFWTLWCKCLKSNICLQICNKEIPLNHFDPKIHTHLTQKLNLNHFHLSCNCLKSNLNIFKR